MGLPVKVLKKRFDIDKEELDNFLRLMPYHRAYIATMKDIAEIRKQPIPKHEKDEKIQQLRKHLREIHEQLQ